MVRVILIGSVSREDDLPHSAPHWVRCAVGVQCAWVPFSECWLWISISGFKSLGGAAKLKSTNYQPPGLHVSTFS